MEEWNRCVCFTGHRTLYEDAGELRARVERNLEALVREGVTTCLCGGAAGFDLLCGEAVLSRADLGLSLVLAVPCPGQDMYYATEDKRRYAHLREGAAEVVVLAQRYHRYCMMVRNRFMVDHAKYVVCYLRKESGGTYQTREYARLKNRVLCEL